MKAKRGFTLAELMIVLAILGIVSAVLTPIVFNAAPDENKLKFKKAYYTLQRTVDAVINSDTYTEGNMGNVPPTADPSKVMCYSFLDMLNTMYDNCEATNAIVTNNSNPYVYDSTNATTSLDTLDSYCTATSVSDPFQGGNSNLPKFITQDGIYWWGFDYDFDSSGYLPGSSTIRTDYAIVCVDVDGSGPEQAIAFGVRHDGKVMVGNKARQWLGEGSGSVIQTEN